MAILGKNAILALGIVSRENSTDLGKTNLIKLVIIIQIRRKKSYNYILC
jgi:hypothetical protein